MSKIDELIQEYCPDGVNYSTIGDECERVFAGGTPKTSNREYYGGNIPWLRSGEIDFDEIHGAEIKITELGYSNSSAKWIKPKSVLIAMTGATVAKSAILECKATANQSVCAMEPGEKLNYRFLYYYLSQNYRKIKGMAQGALTSVNLSIVKSIKVPVPPLEVQHEIVNILDKFTQLEAELSAELDARRKQYKYYLNHLLTVDNVEGVRRTTLGEIGEFTRGNGPQKKDFTDSGIGCIHYGQIYTHYGTFTNKTKIFVSEEVAKRSKKARPGNLVIATTSENDEDVCKAVAWLGDSEIAISNHTAIFAHNENPKYMAYLFQTQDFFKQKKRYIKGTKVKDVSADSIAKFEVSLPLRDEQDRIVEILDKFDAMTNSISKGLPAEINARRQQYEYYRTKLLTFQELPA